VSGGARSLEIDLVKREFPDKRGETAGTETAILQVIYVALDCGGGENIVRFIQSISVLWL